MLQFLFQKLDFFQKFDWSVILSRFVYKKVGLQLLGALKYLVGAEIMSVFYAL